MVKSGEFGECWPLELTINDGRRISEKNIVIPSNTGMMHEQS